MVDRLLGGIDITKSKEENFDWLISELERMDDKETYCHYFDIRTNGLNEKDWRRSFSINQLLYGMILYVEKNHKIETFDEIMKQLQDKYGQANIVNVQAMGKVYNTEKECFEAHMLVTYKDGSQSIVKQEI